VCTFFFPATFTISSIRYFAKTTLFLLTKEQQFNLGVLENFQLASGFRFQMVSTESKNIRSIWLMMCQYYYSDFMFSMTDPYKLSADYCIYQFHSSGGHIFGRLLPGGVAPNTIFLYIFGYIRSEIFINYYQNLFSG